MKENEIGTIILDASYTVHSALGPGLLENCYESCLEYELKKRGVKVERQKPIPVIYQDVKVDCGYRLDLLVEDKVVIELKSIAEINELHKAQLLTYLKLGKFKLGYLINFNVPHLKDGIKRVIN